MQNKKIKNFSEVINGYPFRVGLKIKEKGDICVVRAKDVGEEIYLDDKKLDYIDNQGFREKFFLKKGDVVLSTRGKIRAAVLNVEKNNIIASSSVYMIRVNSDFITPEYLAVYLNSLIGQKQINKRITGAAIKTILKKDLKDIQIKIPEVKKQKEIVDFYKISSKQSKLLQKKNEIYKEMSEGVILTLINNN